MPDIRLQDAIGLHAWANMLVNNRESWRIEQINAQVDFYGEDDAAYLVINHYTSANTGIEYVFLAVDEQDKNTTSIMIFDLLCTVNFSLDELLIWLAKANFQDTDMGEMAFGHGLKISRKTVSIH
ncbi:MAG: hypothetical protein RL748_1046 [Pseudomonadota bacterium]|jgi:hypothetical protein